MAPPGRSCSGEPSTGLAWSSSTPSAAAIPGEGTGPSGFSVHRYDFKARKTDVPLTGVTAFQMSFGGEKALYRQGQTWFIAALHPMSNGPGGGPAPAAPPVPPPAIPASPPEPAAPQR